MVLFGRYVDTESNFFRVLSLLLVLCMLFSFCTYPKQVEAAEALTLAGAVKIVGALLASLGLYEVVRNSEGINSFTKDFLNTIGGVEKGLLALQASLVITSKNKLVLRLGEIKAAFDSLVHEKIQAYNAAKSHGLPKTKVDVPYQGAEITQADLSNYVKSGQLSALHKSEIAETGDWTFSKVAIGSFSFGINDFFNYQDACPFIYNSYGSKVNLLKTFTIGAFVIKMVTSIDESQIKFLVYKYGKLFGYLDEMSIYGSSIITGIGTLFASEHGNEIVLVVSTAGVSHGVDHVITYSTYDRLHNDSFGAIESSLAGRTITYNPAKHKLRDGIALPIDDSYNDIFTGNTAIGAINELDADSYDGYLGNIDGKVLTPADVQVGEDGKIKSIGRTIADSTAETAERVKEQTGILTDIKTGVGDLAKTIGDLPNKLFNPPKEKKIDWPKFKSIGLEKVFPFCIPWDFYNGVKLFAKPAKTPDSTISLHTKYFSINQKIDLSPYKFYIGFFRYSVLAFLTVILAKKTKEMIS